ncbi:SpoIIE family protein phosphatase [Conexibacter woesei]|uniref:SpoIIE family protein phosphatase n=1 Tax=Conexibacter woesei TaxID=191495 RepID=UPI00040E1C72|nr:SpoIIE family protein phosphatase [Conexibacter woesei]
MSGEVLLDAAGALRACYEETDWSATSLGPMDAWSPALRGAVDLALHSSFPMTLLWGPEFTMVYNEAYTPLIAEKHPAALGRPAREVLSEAWHLIGPMMEGVRTGGGTTYVQDEHVPLLRRGFLEECYFTFSFSPVRDEDGAVEGLMAIATETTQQVLDQRRLGLLTRLAGALGDLQEAGELPALALPLLRADTRDLRAVDFQLLAQVEDVRLEDAPGGEGCGRLASLAIGARRHGGEQPTLVVRLSEELAVDDAYLGFLRLLATTLGQALDRVVAREAERSVAAATRELAEALQRSLLTHPPALPGLQLAVRYIAAAKQAQIGGDWYDAFLVPDGSLVLVIGDVAGHDQHAAAAMAQARNLLRGVAQTAPASPARVLQDLDAAMRTLEVDVLATVVLAQLDTDAQGRRTLRWSNAGHPPPALIAPDGAVRLLESRPDLMLGAGRHERADHEVVLEPGATVVFYTDGLIERRSASLDDGMAWLTRVLAGQDGRDAEAVCDHVLAQLPGVVEDDVALLTLRLG